MQSVLMNTGTITLVTSSVTDVLLVYSNVCGDCSIKDFRSF